MLFLGVLKITKQALVWKKGPYIRYEIYQRNVTKHSKSDINPAEDFREVVITSHILAANYDLHWDEFTR